MKYTAKHALVCILLLTPYAFADTSKAVTKKENRFSQPATVAYFEPMAVFPKLDEVKEVTISIQRELEERYKKVQDKQKEYAQLKQELENMGSAASDTAREAKRNKLLSLESEIKIAINSGQEFEQRKKQEIEMDIAEKMKFATSAVRETYDIDLVLAGVVDADPKLNITDEVVEQMNKTYAAAKPKKEAQKTTVA